MLIRIVIPTSTSTLLQVLYKDEKKPDKDMSFKDLLLKIRLILRKKNFTQIPQLSSSHPMKIETKFDLSPPDCRGKKRAVLIGINYAGSSAELYGCHNDVLNMKVRKIKVIYKIYLSVAKSLYY